MVLGFCRKKGCREAVVSLVCSFRLGLDVADTLHLIGCRGSPVADQSLSSVSNKTRCGEELVKRYSTDLDTISSRSFDGLPLNIPSSLLDFNPPPGNV